MHTETGKNWVSVPFDHPHLPPPPPPLSPFFSSSFLLLLLLILLLLLPQALKKEIREKIKVKQHYLWTVKELNSPGITKHRSSQWQDGISNGELKITITNYIFQGHSHHAMPLMYQYAYI